MNRRHFFSTLPAAGAGLSALCSAAPDDRTTGRPPFTSLPAIGWAGLPLVEKVRLAMLSMQRAPWEQGVAMQALLESGERELVILMAKEAVLRQSEDGRLAMLGEESALSDAASPGEAVLWAARETGDPHLKQAVDRLLDYILHRAPRSPEGVIYHFTNMPQVWSDIMYMLPPFLAAAGMFEEAVRQIDGPYGLLWDPQKRLLSHMWDCEKKAFARKDCWGVGNGWSAAGITRVIRALPRPMQAERQRLIGYVRGIVDGCLAHLRADGLFHNVVDDPATFVETNLAQMLAHTIYRGVRGGWFDRSYLERADRMREAARHKVDNLGLVQGVCGSPLFDRPGTATEGQAFFLLMESAHAALAS